MAHTPNDLSKQLVKNMAKFLPKRNIALYMGLDVKTLNKHYKEELKEGVKLKIKLVNTAIDIALKDKNVVMIKFLLQSIAGLSEGTDVSGNDDEVEDNKIDKIEVVIAKPNGNISSK